MAHHYTSRISRLTSKQNKAVFIDKDGTLIPDIPYNVDADLITLERGAVEGLRFLQAEGYLLIIITNQSGVAQGYFEEKELGVVQRKIMHLLRENNIVLDGFYYCPHHPAGIIKEYAKECASRKPGSGLLLQAAKDHNINLSLSWMIGDILNDVEAGNKAGCRTILINNGNETEWLTNKLRTPDYLAEDLSDAAGFILHKEYYNSQTL